MRGRPGQGSIVDVVRQESPELPDHRMHKLTPLCSACVTHEWRIKSKGNPASHIKIQTETSRSLRSPSYFRNVVFCQLASSSPVRIIMRDAQHRKNSDVRGCCIENYLNCLSAVSSVLFSLEACFRNIGQQDSIDEENVHASCE
jgi:hypothetical protein